MGAIKNIHTIAVRENILCPNLVGIDLSYFAMFESVLQNSLIIARPMSNDVSVLFGRMIRLQMTGPSTWTDTSFGGRIRLLEDGFRTSG